MKKCLFSLLLWILAAVFCPLPTRAAESEALLDASVSSGGTVSVSSGGMATVSSGGVVSVSDLKYSFANTREAFKYGPEYEIPLIRYSTLYGTCALAEAYYAYDSSVRWSGNAFGMAASSALLFQPDSGISPEMFHPGAARPSDLAVTDRDESAGMMLRDLIESLQILQKDPIIQAAYRQNLGRLAELCQETASFQTDGKNPVLIALGNQDEGRVLVGYRLVRETDHIVHLMAYDCCFPDAACYLVLSQNDSGEVDGGWSYDYNMNEETFWGSHDEQCWISYLPYSTLFQAWSGAAEHGAAKMGLLTANTRNANISENQRSIAVFRDGKLETGEETVYPLLNPCGGKYQRQDFAVWLPAGVTYTVTAESGDRLETALIHPDQSVTVSVSGNTASVYAEDSTASLSVFLDEMNRAYTVRFHSTLPDSEAQGEMAGTTVTDRTGLALIGGKFYALGTDPNNPPLYTDGTPAVFTNPERGGGTDTPNSAGGKSGSDEFSFADVPPELYCYKAVQWAVRRGITNGTSATEFSPNMICTRAHILTFLWRACGYPEPAAANPFEDVKESTYYAKAAIWAFEKGLVSGERFEGDTSCTRAATVAYLWKLDGDTRAASSDGVPEFIDLPSDAEYAGAVVWAVERGITRGTTETTFSPDRICTRGQIVTFLYRYYVDAA